MNEETKVDKMKVEGYIRRAMDGELTAHEIAKRVYSIFGYGYGFRQDVQPRLTEMMARNEVEVVGKKFDEETRKYVSVYRRCAK